MKITLLLTLAFLCSITASSAQVEADPKLAALLETIRIKYRLPSLAGAIFTTNGVVKIAAVGVRKAGTTIPVTTSDLWQLGSDTKVMTAMLVGTYVAEGKLSWDDKVISFFPDISGKIPNSIKDITIAQVLCHQAGLLVNLSPTWTSLFLSGTLQQQRLKAAHAFLESPAYAPGSFHYSNGDYIVIGAILEKIGGKPWEDLMRERIFAPLHMDSAGFGGTGTLGQIDQPWPHVGSGAPTYTNGPAEDNPPYMGPAGTVHCSINDWGKFLVDQLRGGNDLPALLPKPIYLAIQTPGPHSDYGFGWHVSQRTWAGGPMLSHRGTNTMNYAGCWLGPKKEVGVLVCTNQGGEAAGLATNAAAEAMLSYFLGQALK